MQSFVFHELSFIFYLQRRADEHLDGKRQKFMLPSLLLCVFRVFKSGRELVEGDTYIFVR